jgi:hypothetical protein
LPPGAFRSGLFEAGVLTSSPSARASVSILLRAGWAGYFAIPWAFADLNGFIPEQWREISGIVASSLISLLYASQAAVLHFGRARDASLPGNSVSDAT